MDAAAFDWGYRKPMTSPDPYPVPGEFPDVEQVLVDLLTPIRYTCTTLPSEKDTFDAAVEAGLIWARRTGGAIDADQLTDHALVQLSILSHKRRDSQAIAAQARKAVLGSAGTRVNGVLVDWAEETAGVIELPDMDPLNRMVHVGFLLYFRRQF
jgi:hypothetical protein